MVAESKRTASSHTTEVETATHSFKIVGYTLNKGMGVGESIQSGTFAVGGYDWAICFYPDGCGWVSKDYAVVYLKLLSKTAKVLRASYNLSLVNQTTGLPEIVFSATNARVGTRGLDDCFTIECILSVVKEPRVETLWGFEIDVPPSDLTEHFGNLLLSEEGADVTFSVRGATFPAHKIVLAARSPVFKAQLYGQMKESRARCVTVEDMQPDVFKSLLEFIYTDSLPDWYDLDAEEYCEIARHLLAAADRYAMDRLKLLCASILVEDLDVENVATMLAIADQHNCDRLKGVCVEFMASSKEMDAVVKTEGYANLKRTRPSILVDVPEMTSNCLKLKTAKQMTKQLLKTESKEKRKTWSTPYIPSDHPVTLGPFANPFQNRLLAFLLLRRSSAAGRPYRVASSCRPLHSDRERMVSESKRTASSHTTEVETATHSFKIVGYSLNKGMCVGKSIQSGTFTVGGCDWAICFYPGGSNLDAANKDYANVYLKLVSKSANVWTSYNLSLVNQTTGLPESVFSATNARVFTRGRVETEIGLHAPIHRRKLECKSAGYIVDDCLTIECTVSVLKESRVETLGNFEIDEGADVTFSVRGATFPAHKIVLAAQSPVFKAQLYGQMKESRARCVTVEDMQPDVFKSLLEFIYTDSLPDWYDLDAEEYCEIARHLLAAADRYAMDRLKLLCASILVEDLDVENVATMLAIADQHNCDRLKGVCVEFMASSKEMDAVVKTEGYANLKRTRPSILVDVPEMTSKTASSHTTEVETATHSFKIVGYSLNKGMCVGKSIQSGTFTVGGCDWAICFYPGGSNLDAANKDYANVYLKLVSKSANVWTSYNLSLVNQTTGLPESVFSATNARVFTRGRVETEIGLHAPIHRRKLECKSAGYIVDDCLTIECTVSVLKESRVETLGNFEIDEGADVTFSVRGATFPAHKIVLAAQSPVFKAQLYGQMKESRARCVTVEDMQPDVFKSLLEFIYTDSLPDWDDLDAEEYCEIAGHLLAAADRYAMDRLKLLCASILVEDLDVENVATTLAIADQHNCDRLKGVCVEFMASSKEMDAVVKTEGYANLKRTRPSILVDVLEMTS
ncbi:hypothetical protein U9M48_039120, partial [Paspalum notatum var. saurae]